MMEKNEVAFSVVGDISNSHRRFKHREEELGFLGCQIDEAIDIVYVNKVGTFGVCCASYWWTRIVAAGLRATHHLLGKLPLHLLLYADDLESLATTLEVGWGWYLAIFSCPRWATPSNGPRVGEDSESNGWGWNPATS